MSLQGIDRLSRDFIYHPQYRSNMSNKMHNQQIYDVRMNLPNIYSNGRPVGAAVHARTALDYSLVHAADESYRIELMYNIKGTAYLSSVDDAYGYSFRGQNIDLMA